MKFKKLKLAALAVSLLSLQGQAQSNLLLRFPAVNNNGSTVAFSYQGDIWTVPAAGGTATRLTIHPAYEANPVFSPDGKWIAFSGDRYGNNDVFVMPTIGGTPKRLTYHSAADQIQSWRNDGQIIFSTSREFKQIERPQEVYGISANGGTEMRLLDAVCHDPVYSPNGRYLALVRGDLNPVAREDYKGPSNRELWIYDTKTKTYAQMPGTPANDVMPRWASNSSLYFLSSNDETYNLYKQNITEAGKSAGSPEKVTNFKDEAIRHFDISADGNTMVFEKDMHIYIAQTNDPKNMRKLPVTINADDRLDPTEVKTFTSGASSYSVSPNGKWLAFEQRGEIFVKEADKEKSRTVNVSNNANRDIDPVWVNDSVLLFSSDRNDGNFEFYAVASADPAHVDMYWSLKYNVTRLTNTPIDETNAVISNNGTKVVYSRGRGEFLLANIAGNGKLTNEKMLFSQGWKTPNAVQWSPDDQYLAFTESDLYFNTEVFIYPIDGSRKPVNVSMHPRTDRSPVWSPDGSKLGFVSGRNNRTDDVYFVWLKKDDYEKTRQDWTDAPPEPKMPSANGKEKELTKKPKPVEIDFDNMHERTVQVTSFPGDESNVAFSKDGETIYYTAQGNTNSGSDLYSIKWNGQDLKEITKGGSSPGRVQADAQGNYLYMVRRGALARINAKTGVQESLPYSAKMHIDYAAERNQVFEEGWRAIRDGFYDPNYHGQNWQKLHDKYKPRCLAASTSDDLKDMFNLMLGELNASHMGLSTPSRVETQTVSTGLLGAELIPTANGMKVVHIIPETPASRTTSMLNEGDIITAVNGQSYSTNENFYMLLNGTINEQTLLNVTTANGVTKEVIIRPTGSVRQQLYQEWVNERKRLVDKYSNGKLGYIHIQGMNMPSFEVVEREFTAAGYGKDGLVIDVRYNGGGSTTDYLMTVLNYKQHSYTIPRGASSNLEKDKLQYRDYYPIGERLVFSAWIKPSIAMINEGSYSNAEIFGHAYKQLGIGKLVGQSTNGSVISTGSAGLMDGSSVRMPFRAWYTKATDKNQELGPAVPDVIVNNDINWISIGEDKQLKVAVETLLKDMKK